MTKKKKKNRKKIHAYRVNNTDDLNANDLKKKKKEKNFFFFFFFATYLSLKSFKVCHKSLSHHKE